MASINRGGTWVVLGSSLLLALSGCGAQGNESVAENTEITRSALDASECYDAIEGGGWVNHPMPDSAGLFSASWRSYPSTHPLDNVMGLSNGEASAFTDLGPIVRFGSGYIQARNGAGYFGAFPYTSGDGPYEFQLRVDVPAHHYSVWVRHLDAVYKPFELLGQDLAFRDEQGSVASLDNWGSVMDSSGHVQSCRFSYNPSNGCIQSTADGVWRSRPFDDRLSQSNAHVELHAWVDASNVDGVIGVANGTPTAFNQLAAIVRFRPDGRMDVRNGSTYAADAEFTYAPNTYYTITIDLDLTAHTYSVSIWRDDATGTFVQLAHGYAFRTEQAGITNVDHVAQFVDGTAGSLNTCATQAL